MCEEVIFATARGTLSDGTVTGRCSDNSGSASGSGGSNSCCIVYPHQVRRKSKGKPENVCQLMAMIQQKTTLGSTTLSAIQPPQKTKTESTLLKGRSISVATVNDFRNPKSSGSSNATAATTVSSLALKKFSSQLRSPRYFEMMPNLKQFAPYTPPPMLSPMRRGSGLFWNISQSALPESNRPNSSQESIGIEGVAGKRYPDYEGSSYSNRRANGTDEEPPEKRSRRSMVAATLQSGNKSATDEDDQRRQLGATPVRKNGLCYPSQLFDAKLLCLEALRKESDASWNGSHSPSIPSNAAATPRCVIEFLL
ncbi:unnamed protein product [Gongylonema pulchrum]|uniref:Uncharacterized protein n=1 Tax=Gongylonema pulchrum TaxID=637853 RepID=A0A183DUP1_9BILA|nr:unnamed protein product [Gongylonema pulchrum]